MVTWIKAFFKKKDNFLFYPEFKEICSVTAYQGFGSSSSSYI